MDQHDMREESEAETRVAEAFDAEIDQETNAHEDGDDSTEREPTKQPFLCPECGSTNEGFTFHVSPMTPVDEDGNWISKWDDDGNIIDPWLSVYCNKHCADCNFIIPEHLALRWDEMTPEAARQEWQRVYRSGANLYIDHEYVEQADL